MMTEWASKAHNPQPKNLDYSSKEAYWRAYAMWKIQDIWEEYRPQIVSLHTEGEAVQKISGGKIELITDSPHKRIYNILDQMKRAVTARVFPTAYHFAQHKGDITALTHLKDRVLQETRNMVFTLTSPEQVRYTVVVVGRKDLMMFDVNVRPNFL